MPIEALLGTHERKIIATALVVALYNAHGQIMVRQRR